MKKELGTIVTPEQYAQADDNIVIGDSLTAERFFKESYPDVDGCVCLGVLRTYSLIPEYQTQLLWLYIDINNETICSTIPVFEITDFEKFGNSLIKSLEHIEKEIFFKYNNSIYTNVPTSTGEIIIKKIRSVISSVDAVTLARSIDGLTDVTNAYPVELYSHETGEFVCCCWSLEDGGNEPIWRCICYDDYQKLKPYAGKMLREICINLDETAFIGGNNFVLRQNNVFGYYFEKYIDIYDKKSGKIIELTGRKTIKVPKLRTEALKSENSPRIITLRIPSKQLKRRD